MPDLLKLKSAMPLLKKLPKRILSGVIGGLVILLISACSIENTPVTPTPISIPPQPLEIEVSTLEPSATPTLEPSQTPIPTDLPTQTPIPTDPPTIAPPLTDTPQAAPPAEGSGVRVIATYVGPIPSGAGGESAAPSNSGNTEVASAGGAPVREAQNLDFSGGEFKQTFQEINVPIGWTAWWREGQIDCWLYENLPTDGACPLLTDPNAFYKRPEFTLISASQSVYANRVRSGNAARFFCTYAICMGGYHQQVSVTPGAEYVFSAYAFSWCAPEGYNINQSKLDTNDDRRNCQVAIGLDPNGGTNPYSGSIIWTAANYYDAYGYLQTPPVAASGSTMTLFMRGRSLWGFRHTDFHFDDLNFTRR